jgi:hypothetical protein
MEGWSAIGTCYLKEANIRERRAYPSTYVGSESTCIALYIPVGGIYVEWEIWDDDCTSVETTVVTTAHRSSNA